MSNHSPSITSAKAMARLAGFSYLMYGAAGHFNILYIGPRISGVFSDVSKITPAAEAIYRQGIIAETVLYLAVVMAGASMYGALRLVSPGLSAVAGSLRVAEGVLGIVFLVCSYIGFTAVTGDQLVGAFSDEQRVALRSLFVGMYSSGLFILLIFMGVGATTFFTLFFRYRLIPRWLAAWGIVTYTVMVVLSLSIILHPPFQEHVMLFFAPGALFEWIAGLWLLFMGINTTHWEEEADL